MKTIVLFILLSVLPCQAEWPNHTDARSLNNANQIAIHLLDSIGFYIPAKSPEIFIYHDLYYMQVELGLSQQYKGWYDPIHKDIHLFIHAPFEAIIHEHMHYYLHAADVPTGMHHKIIRKVL